MIPAGKKPSQWFPSAPKHPLLHVSYTWATSNMIPTLKMENIQSLCGFQTFIMPVRIQMLCQEMTCSKHLVHWMLWGCVLGCVQQLPNSWRENQVVLTAGFWVRSTLFILHCRWVWKQFTATHTAEAAIREGMKKNKALWNAMFQTKHFRLCF